MASAGIGGSARGAGGLGVTFDEQAVTILNDPLDGLALFEFEGLGERSGADQIELAGLVGAFDDLDLGQITHKAMITLAISLVNRKIDFFTRPEESP
jgi:hypothetical protein